jgi:hypothetical protein
MPYVFFPVLKFDSGNTPHAMPALLCPANRDGYPTRLFLEKKIPSRGNNWNVFQIRSRSWWACSWRDVPASLPWLAILANHLRPLR